MASTPEEVGASGHLVGRPPTLGCKSCCSPKAAQQSASLGNLPIALSVSVEIVGRAILGDSGTARPVISCAAYDRVGRCERTRCQSLLDRDRHQRRDRVHGTDALVRVATTDTPWTRCGVRVFGKLAHQDRAVESNI